MRNNTKGIVRIYVFILGVTLLLCSLFLLADIIFDEKIANWFEHYFFGYLSLLDEATDMPVEQREKYVHITLDKAYRLEKMINEFFEITRYNAEQIVLAKEKIDLYYMLVRLSDELYPTLIQRGNTVKINADEKLPEQDMKAHNALKKT